MSHAAVAPWINENKTTAASPARAALYNPCTIPDDAIRAAGVDPASQESGIGGVPQSGWEICAWKGDQYAITVYSSARSIDDYRGKPGNVEFQNVTIARRAGEQFRVAGGSKDLKCDVVFTTAQGSVQIALVNLPGVDGLPDPCKSLPAVAAQLIPHLPK
ncbi:DUF3558 domain-containing protein [Nocardia sp. NPDC051787]|uniref:DUF3558 domain-containing protein n=1 Tax=Nocardia sp. NPDC051787 TaxID=3155415 RepID=UPI0034242F62